MPAPPPFIFWGSSFQQSFVVADADAAVSAFILAGGRKVDLNSSHDLAFAADVIRVYHTGWDADTEVVSRAIKKALRDGIGNVNKSQPFPIMKPTIDIMRTAVAHAVECLQELAAAVELAEKVNPDGDADQYYSTLLTLFTDDKYTSVFGLPLPTPHPNCCPPAHTLIASRHRPIACSDDRARKVAAAQQSCVTNV